MALFVNLAPSNWSCQNGIFMVHQGDAILRPAALALKAGALSLPRSVNPL